MEDKPNQETISKLSTKDQEILDLIEKHINFSRYFEAIELIHLRLTEEFNYDEILNEFLKTELSMLLIDAGAEGRFEDVVKEGIKLIELAFPVSKIIDEGYFYYNIGNAKDALFNITTKEKYFNIPENIKYLIEAKDNYWKSLNYFQRNNIEPPIQLYVNLGNVLYSCNRLSESIQMYDIVLKRVPDFPQANINRSRCLIYMNLVNETFTPNQIMQAREGFMTALKSEIYPLFWREFCEQQVESLATKLIELGIDLNSYEHETKISSLEAKQHSNYRNFCIEKKICLNEHSIYCNCSGARNDDLIISHKAVRGDFVPEMELLLNRVKSEFSLARWMYFEAFSSFSNVDEIINENITFLELYEDEIIGAKSEMIRNSFRMCFGILDKIAVGICKLLNLLSKPDEMIYFHSFWKNNKNPERWEKISTIENPFILALYTLASDLNINGQLKRYKDWRNDLEHKVIILSEKENSDASFLLENDKNRIYKYVNFNQFSQSTEHLLHLTASAILYFVYAVRHEGLKEKSSKNAGTIMLKSKV